MTEPDMDPFTHAHDTLSHILQNPFPPLPDPTALAHAASTIRTTLPTTGVGFSETSSHLHALLPGFNGQSLSPTYYGFVQGGITPAARLADAFVTLFDQTAQVHLPGEAIATTIEHRALSMLLELFEFDAAVWLGRTLTTGATGSNILGLACGREFVVSERLARKGQERKEGEGLLGSCLRAGIEGFQILTTLPHSSLGKAANIVGLGSGNMVDVTKEGHFLDFDMGKLEECLAKPGTACIVVISCGEVNTGAFATNSYEEVKAIRELCDKYGAWIHVDAAFGLFARVLPDVPKYARVRAGAAGLELADSITGDGHKLLNVPYDCGFFFCRHRDIPARVCQNTNAAYLSATSADGIPSPLNIHLENSARFRGLPVYATLLSFGRSGYADMIARMVDQARGIAKYIRDECPHLQLLPQGWHDDELESLFMCVLFRAKDNGLNEELTAKIKATRKLYGSGTKWEGKTATRFAIGKWNVDVERDLAVVRDVLSSIR